MHRVRPPSLLAAALGAIAGLAAQDPLTARVGAALDRARPALLRHLGRAELGELALLLLAAVHDEVPRDHPAMRRAIDRLARAELDDTYGLSLRLMVMAELADFPDRDALAARDAALLQRRQTSGGYSYHEHDGWWDLSNTQYAALGLRAAAALGHDTPRERWQLLYTSLQLVQHEDGGFTYRPSQGESSAYASMTVAGIAVLEVCAQMLALDGAERRHHDARVARGWDWMAARSHEIADHRTEHLHYFLYGLERAAILSDVERIGDVDWYAAGAGLLCDRQLGGGGWYGLDELRRPAPRTSNGHPVDTAFAVLFLRRKFQKVQAPVTGPRGLAAAALPADADDAAIAAAAARDAARGEAAVPRLLLLLHSDARARRCAAAAALRAITRQDFGLRPELEPQADRAAIHGAVLWWLRRQSAAAGPAAGPEGAGTERKRVSRSFAEDREALR
ncbi:MAG: hypothetical protein AB7O97_14865 [Planctomycetota bacterium]